MPKTTAAANHITIPVSRPRNRERSVALGALVAFLLFLIGIFLPGLIGMDMVRYGFGLGFISLFLALVSLVVFFVYAARANSLDTIFKSDALVHWVYPPQDWSAYAKKEYETQKTEKRNLWLMIAVITLVVGLFFGLTHQDAWAFTLIFMLSLLFSLYLVSILAPAFKYHSDLRNQSEAYISKAGVYLTGEFHNWGMLSSRLESANFEADKKLLSITYSYIVRYGRDSCTVRVPVPKGQEKKAREVANALTICLKGRTS